MGLRRWWWLVAALALVAPPPGAAAAAAEVVDHVLVDMGGLAIVSVDGAYRIELPVPNTSARQRRRLTDGGVAFTRQGPDTGGNGGSGPYQDIDLFVVATDGSTPPRLLSGDTVDNFESPRWSPDSRHLGFTTYSVFYLRTPPRWHRAGLIDVTSGGRRLLASLGDDARVHGWSPDGRLLVSSPHLATVALDGSEVRPMPVHAWPGRWSPDGRSYAWGLRRPDDTCELWVGDHDAERPRVVLPRVASGARWAWAPDSARIVYADGDVHVVTLGGRRTTITATGHELAVAVSPDGSIIATTSDRDRPASRRSQDLVAHTGVPRPSVRRDSTGR